MTDKLDSPFDKEQAPRVSRLWSLACLGISAIAYWPATMIGDMLLRGTSLGRALGYSNENPLDDVVSIVNYYLIREGSGRVCFRGPFETTRRNNNH